MEDLEDIVKGLEATSSSFGKGALKLAPAMVKDTQDHWEVDWVGRDGTGPEYWPYAQRVDIRNLLNQAFIGSVKVLMNAKQDRPDVTHNTTWICMGKPPVGHEDWENNPIDGKILIDIFKFAVVDHGTTVSLLIATPEPLPQLNEEHHEVDEATAKSSGRATLAGVVKENVLSMSLDEQKQGDKPGPIKPSGWWRSIASGPRAQLVERMPTDLPDTKYWVPK
jgi:hypothetical protein